MQECRCCLAHHNNKDHPYTLANELSVYSLSIELFCNTSSNGTANALNLHMLSCTSNLELSPPTH